MIRCDSLVSTYLDYAVILCHEKYYLKIMCPQKKMNNNNSNVSSKNWVIVLWLQTVMKFGWRLQGQDYRNLAVRVLPIPSQKFNSHFLTFIRVHSQEVIPGSGCYIRTCDQTITGRNLAYSVALRIIQNEDYLTAADLSILRIKRDVTFTNDTSLTVSKHGFEHFFNRLFLSSQEQFL